MYQAKVNKMQDLFSNLAKIRKERNNKMNINKFKRLLAERGFSYSRRGKGSHEIWVNENGESFSFPSTRKEVYIGIVWNFRRNYCRC